MGGRNVGKGVGSTVGELTMRNPKGHPVIASLIDRTMAPLRKIRTRVVPFARGRVLEIGFGTGLNLEHYDWSQIDSLVAIEPDPHMRRRAAQRVAQEGYDVGLVEAFAEALPFDDADFDEVLITFTLCTVPDPEGALAEVRRVLRPDGRLRFAEHTISDFGPMRALQHAIDPVWCRVAAGCHVTRDSVALIGAAGFELGEVKGHGRNWYNVTPIHRGVARRR